MTEPTFSTDPNREIIQSLLKAKSQEINMVSIIYQYLAELYPTTAASSIDFENPTETPPLTSSKPLPSRIPETKPEDEIVAANSSTDAHGDLLALLQPMFNSGIIKLVGKPEEQGIIYINLKAKDPFAKPLTKAEYNVLPDKDKVFYFPIIDVNINAEHKTPYIFLGDALDRGEFSINCLLQIIYILRKQQDLMKEGKLTKQIFTALLGNHEIAYLFKKYELIFHESFVAKLPGFIKQEIISKEIFKKILTKADIEDISFYESYHSWIEESISTSILNLLQECDNIKELTNHKIKEKILEEELNKLIFLQDEKYNEFKNNLADYVSKKTHLEIQKKIEYIDAISDLMWQNIDLFNFCKAVKIKEGTPEEKIFVYSHAPLPQILITKILDVAVQNEIITAENKNGIIEKITQDRKELTKINWEELNNFMKTLVKDYNNSEKTINRELILTIINYLTSSRLEFFGDKYKIGYQETIFEPENYYDFSNIYNIFGHMPVYQDFVTRLYENLATKQTYCIPTDMASSYYYSQYSNPLSKILTNVAPQLGTASGTTLTQNGNVYMNFYDLLSLMQDESSEYLMKIIPNTKKEQLIYSASQIAKIETLDPLQESIKLCSEMFQYLDDDGNFNNEEQFMKFFNKIRYELLPKIPEGDDKNKLRDIIIKCSSPKDMKDKFKQNFLVSSKEQSPTSPSLPPR